MIQFNNIEDNKHSLLGRHFMASLLWNTEPEKLIAILKVMMKTYERYGLPIDYYTLGIEEA